MFEAGGAWYQGGFTTLAGAAPGDQAPGHQAPW